MHICFIAGCILEIVRSCLDFVTDCSWIRTSSRHLYYEIQAKAGLISKQELLSGFPVEELESSVKYEIQPSVNFQLPDVKKLIANVGKPVFRGYAFSQDEPIPKH